MNNIEENKRLKFGYEDTDKKIEIELYGLVFEIDKKRILNKDIKEINENDEETVEREIKELIGENAIEKINDKRLKDGYDRMTLDVEVAVLTCIYKSYIIATSGTMIDGIMNTNKELENKARNLNNVNREKRRYNNRNYRRYNIHRRY